MYCRVREEQGYLKSYAQCAKLLKFCGRVLPSPKFLELDQLESTCVM